VAIFVTFQILFEKKMRRKKRSLFQCKMCLLSKTFTTFAKSKKWRKKKLALTSNQKYLISPLISVGQHESVSYAQDFCGRVREHL
jgi:hypothetical protein